MAYYCFSLANPSDPRFFVVRLCAYLHAWTCTRVSFERFFVQLVPRRAANIAFSAGLAGLMQLDETWRVFGQARLFQV